MSRPTSYPDWALSDVTDGVSGQPNVSEPPASGGAQGDKDEGWKNNTYPPRQYMNWFMRFCGLWIRWLESLVNGLIPVYDTYIDVVYGSSQFTAPITDRMYYEVTPSGWVKINFSGAIGAAGSDSNLQAIGAIPSWACPYQTIYIPVEAQNNSEQTPGVLSIDPSGNIVVYRYGTVTLELTYWQTFDTTGNKGYYSASAVYKHTVPS